MSVIARYISNLIDIIYKPFSRYFSVEFFRYGVCGVSNMILDWVLYFLVYNFILGHKLVRISILAQETVVSAHIMALCIVFPITLFTGFWLNRYVTFRQSKLHGRKQFVRYILIVAVNLSINYLGLKLLVDLCGLYPTPSKMLITMITVAVSYFGQKYYSFK